jgi:hypothetical protein
MESSHQAEPNSDEILENMISRFQLEKSDLNIESVSSYLAGRVVGINVAGLKVVSLTGGAGAGKSTLAENLSKELVGRGVATDHISTDDFVIGTREERRVLEKEKGPLAKYDFEYMNALIDEIRIGRGEVRIPSYNEGTGPAIPEGKESYNHRIEKLHCLIVEGDFDATTNPDLRVYLLSRMRCGFKIGLIAISKKRGEPDMKRIGDNFHLRQKQQHVPHTLPALERVDIILDARPMGDTGYKYSVYKR